MVKPTRTSSTLLAKAGAAVAVGLVWLLPAVAAAQGIASYSAVTDQRLQAPEPQNWLMYRGNYAGWGYSPLDKITTDNVKRLVPVWTLSTGVSEGHQSPPMVNDGVMFVTTPQNQIFALNAKTGDIYWTYKKQLPEDLLQLHPTNRGVALYQDKVYMATVDAHLVALDAKTGKVLWDKTVDDYKKGYYCTLAPLITKGKVMVGTSGGELAIRGFIEAFDASTGNSLWRTYTIPEPGQPGSETWSGDAWKNGGGSVWIQGTYDPDLNLAFWGVGNAGPWAGDFHPGDNLYTASVIAVDPDAGKIKAHHQYHWNDSWDWDEVTPPMLIDVTAGGRTVKGLVHPGRNGYLWLLERGKDKISFVSAKPYVKQDAFKSIDPVTGRPEYVMERKPARGKSIAFCPSLWGGKDWPPAAYNPKTGLVYIPSNDNHCGNLKSKQDEPVKPGELYLGVEIKDIVLTVPAGTTTIGDLQAWDVGKGERVWSQKFESHSFGPVLTTGGGLVFQGGTNDRLFRAFNAKTGDPLWQFKTNSGVTAVPMSYEVDGVQYIAVQSGWGVDAERMQGALISAGYKGKNYSKDVPIPQGGVLWVFSLGQ
jgi:alcohol dehydrogenase (cytochrome c)